MSRGSGIYPEKSIRRSRGLERFRVEYGVEKRTRRRYTTCDARCWSARSRPSACRCSCGGANHGRGYFAPYRGYPRRPKPPFIGDYFKSIGKSALTSAVIYGLSAAIPPFGAVAIPAYMAYNYSKLGYGLYKVYSEISAEGKASANSMKQASESLGDFVTQDPADTIAWAIVTKARRSGLFEEMAKNTRVDEVVFVETMRGSTSSALSAGAGELAKFAISKAVSA